MQCRGWRCKARARWPRAARGELRLEEAAKFLEVRGMALLRLTQRKILPGLAYGNRAIIAPRTCMDRATATLKDTPGFTLDRSQINY